VESNAVAAPAKVNPSSNTQSPVVAGNVHVTARAATLVDVAATLFPDSPGASENALTDLRILNTRTLSPAQRSGQTVIAGGTQLVMAPWMVTALTIPLKLDAIPSRSTDGHLVPVATQLPKPAAAKTSAASATAATSIATGPTTRAAPNVATERQLAAIALPSSPILSIPSSVVSPTAFISDANPANETVIA
jgi:hypothetical protein